MKIVEEKNWGDLKICDKRKLWKMKMWKMEIMENGNYGKWSLLLGVNLR